MSDRIANRRPQLADVIQQALNNALKDLHTSFPGRIVSFDATNQTATVQPMIKRVFKDDFGEDAALTLPLLIKAPVWLPRAGGFVITFPIEPGDDCLVIISERSLDNWWTFGAELPPKDIRFHHLSDAIVLCGMSPQTKSVTAYNTQDLVLRKESNDPLVALRNNGDIECQAAGSTITIKPSGDITLSSPTKIILDAPITETTSQMTVNGNLQVNGNSDSTGTSSATDHLSNGISGNSHTHGGVQPGSGNTGGPQ